jgi:hypothetical protein
MNKILSLISLKKSMKLYFLIYFVYTIMSRPFEYLCCISPCASHTKASAHLFYSRTLIIYLHKHINNRKSRSFVSHKENSHWYSSIQKTKGIACCKNVSDRTCKFRFAGTNTFILKSPTEIPRQSISCFDSVVTSFHAFVHFEHVHLLF